ncbi:MAG TPA: hypothetical protein VNC16_13270 [Solirubrobacterales bacterium]|jgi:hypothetical protein|nr:hypothetical protein [Solirubrobacterales bacterium]
MNRLRHPIRAIREPFGTAGLVVACIALVAALGGSAFAAAKLTSKQKKEVEKIAKKYAGKPGAPGATGPAGPAGPQGNPGANGAAGKDGTDGTNGTNGISPVGTSFTGNQKGCQEGGVEFKGFNTTVACNGVKGADGAAGLPATLPSGESEYGAYSTGLAGDGESGPAIAPAFVSFSFNIPLSEKPKWVWVNGAGTGVFANSQGTIEDCDGSAAEPEADPGFLCIYSKFVQKLPFDQSPTPNDGEGVNSPYGVVLKAAFSGSGETEFPIGLVSGTWAVTAP